MPFVKVQSNIEIADEQSMTLLSALSSLTANALDKPERYIMVAIEPRTTMIFAGSDEPSCYMECKSIGLPESRTGELSSALSEEIERQLGIPKDRVYIEFTDAPRKMWGWNGTTF